MPAIEAVLAQNRGELARALEFTHAFSRFADEGIFNRETGLDLARCLLERGGSDDPATLFKASRGRAPKVDALLRQSGSEG